MRKIVSLLFSLLPLVCLGQKQKKISACIDFHVNTTLYDRTINNNPVGFGAGVQAFLNTKSRFRPSIEFAGEAFGGTKELYLTPDGRPIYAKDEVLGILAGSSYQFTDKLYFNASAGPSFFNSSTHFTIKPTLGVYFPSNKRFLFKTSLTHIFQHDDISNESFGFLNFALGVRLF